jgi:hypothetical protein
MVWCDTSDSVLELNQFLSSSSMLSNKQSMAFQRWPCRRLYTMAFYTPSKSLVTVDASWPRRTRCYTVTVWQGRKWNNRCVCKSHLDPSRTKISSDWEGGFSCYVYIYNIYNRASSRDINTCYIYIYI